MSTVVGEGTIVIRTDSSSAVRDASSAGRAAGDAYSKEFTSHTGTEAPKAGSNFAKKFGSGASKVAGGALAGVGKVLRVGALSVGGAAGGILGTALFKGFGRLKDIENAQTKLKGLKYSTGQVKTVMDAALKSVQGTSFGLGEAATSAATMSAAGMKLKDTQKTLALIGDTATIAGTDMGDITAIFAKMQVGGKVTGDTLQMLSERGVGALKYLSDELGKPQQAVAKMVSDGKVSFKTFQDAMQKGLGGAAQAAGGTVEGSMKNIGAALSRLGAALLGPVFKQLPNLFNTIIAGFDKLGPIATQIGEVVGKALSDAFQWLIDNWPAISGAIASFAKTAGPAFVAVWQTLTGVVSKVVDVFSALFSGGGADVDQLAGSFGKFAPVIAAVASALALFGQYLPGIVSAISGALGEGGALAGLGGPIGLIIAAIAALIAASPKLRSALVEIAKPVLAFLVPAFEAIFDTVRTLLPVLVNLATTIGDSLGKVLAEVAPIVKDVADELGKALGPAFEAISGAIETIAPVIGEFISMLADRLAPVIAKLEPVIKPLAKLLGKLLVTAARAIAVEFKILAVILKLLMPVISFIAGIVGGVLKAAFTVIAPVLTVVVDAISFVVDAINDLMCAILGCSPGLVPAFQTLSEVVSTVMGAIKTIIKTVFGTIKTIFKNATDALKNTVDKAFNAIKTIVETVIGGVKKTINTVGGAVRGAVSGVAGFFRTAFSNGKDAVVRALGAVKDWIGRIGGWVTNAVANVASKIGGAFSSARDKAASALQSIKDWIGKIPGWVADGVSSVATKVGDAFGKIPSTIRGFGTDVLNAAKSIGSNIITGIGNGISSVMNVGADIASSIKSAINSALHLPFTIKGPGPLPDFTIPAFAHGLVNPYRGGMALVGEAGPEIMYLPRGTKMDGAAATYAAGQNNTDLSRLAHAMAVEMVRVIGKPATVYLTVPTDDPSAAAAAVMNRLASSLA